MTYRINIDLNNATSFDIRKLGRKIIKDTLVIVRNQNLSPERLIEICDLIGDVDNRGQKNPFKHDQFEQITKVTNEKLPSGENAGLFATEELGWHSDINTRVLSSINDCCSAMYIVKTGEDSITSFVNLAAAYSDLSYMRKLEVSKLECWFEFKNNTFYNFEDTDREYKSYINPNSHHVGNWKPLVIEHPTRLIPNGYSADKGLFWSHHFIRKFRDIETKEEYSLEDKQELFDFLMNHVFQEKYIYHHYWVTGDVVFSDQILSLHKRTKPKGDRLLWRVGMNYKWLQWV